MRTSFKMKQNALYLFILLLIHFTNYCYSQNPGLKHPFLLIDSIGIEKVRMGIKDSTWKAKMYSKLKAKADFYLSEKIEIPPTGGNWDHYYVNPKTGNWLTRGKIIGNWKWEHWDKETGEKLISDSSKIDKDYDRIICGYIHDTWSQAILDLGLTYQLSKEDKYAYKAKDILLAYSDLYPTFPVLNKKGNSDILGGTGRGKVHNQSFNEAIWLINLIQGADLIWNTLTEKERGTIINNIFYPSISVINDGNLKIDNKDSWRIAAIGMLGFFMNDHDLIGIAMSDPKGGYNAQTTIGLTKEGFWYERSPSYHFYTLAALVQLANAAKNYGYPVKLTPLKKMFHTPLYLANSALHLPAFNDSHPVDITQQKHLYEWAYSEFRDKKYLKVITSKQRESFPDQRPIFTAWGLIVGEQNLDQKEYIPCHTKNLPNTGIGLLSKSQGQENLSLYLKYDPYSGWHSHADELSFAILKYSDHISMFPEVEKYGSKFYDHWTKTSVSHNTFLVNEWEQSKKSFGKCLEFGTKSDIDYIIAETTTAYDSTRFIRTAALLSENLVLIVDQFESTQKNTPTLDIFYHQLGQWKEIPNSEVWKARKTLGRRGYNHLHEMKLIKNQTDINLSTVTSTGREVMISASSLDPMEVMTGYGENYLNKEAAVVMYRKKTSSTALVYCIALDGTKTDIKIKKVENDQEQEIATSKALKIELKDGSKNKRNIIINPDGLKIKEGKTVTENKFIFQ